MKICVLGLGYIGLPTSVILAKSGYQVCGYDINKEVRQIIRRGEIHIVEPGLEEVVSEVVSSGMLTVHDEPQQADIFVICVPTPFKENEGIRTPDITYVLEAAEQIAGLLNPKNIVIVESTSPVGTLQEVYDRLKSTGAPVDDCHLAYCPERVLPGKIMDELVNNDRIVGGLDPAATEVVSNFYQTFVNGDIHGADSQTAEMCKLAENSFRDVNIAFANELSMLAVRQGVDPNELIRLANLHPRVDILRPGPGVGGHCIAVDPWFLVAADPSLARLIKTGREVNMAKTLWVVDQIRTTVRHMHFHASFRPTIACLGLAFKPDIDDVRTSPAVEIVKALETEGYQLMVVDPNIDGFEGRKLASIDEALDVADVIVVLVGHKEFYDPNVKDRLIAEGALDFCGALAP